MTRPPLPGEIAAGLEDIAGATRELLAAARNLDPEAMIKALETRAAAINTLEPTVVAYRRKAGASGDEALAAAGAQLQQRTDEARENLNSLMEQVRTAVEKLNRESSALRSYTASDSPGALLKRSG